MIEPTHGADTATTGTGVDGRTLRRERGRAAVVDAMIDLVLAGHLPPSVEQLAAASGVSVASIFRYFEGLDELRRSATEVYFDRFAHLLEIPAVGKGPLAERVARVVDARLELYAAAGPIGRLVRLRAHDDATAQDNLRRLRDTHAGQLRQHFDAELSPLAPEERSDLIGVMATLTSFESWEQLRDHEHRTEADIRRAWATALDRLLAAR